MRCAIYTRKSVDESAGSQFSTIENQRLLCEQFTASQAASGWVVLPDRYDDVGHSGATRARPALSRLREDVLAGLVDMVVVHRIDRLSRSLRDFLAIADDLEKAGASLVSVTQQFNTATPMGRLTLNILLSFGQFEREMIGERIKDWKGGARARGLWTSGPAPFGYRTEQLRLVPDPDRAPIVRDIYNRFLQGHRYTVIAEWLSLSEAVNKLGRPLSSSSVKLILTNPVYRGQMIHRGEAVGRTHQPIVSEAAWRRAQDRIAAIAPPRSRAGK